jgi:hypothetical protein
MVHNSGFEITGYNNESAKSVPDEQEDRLLIEFSASQTEKTCAQKYTEWW